MHIFDNISIDTFKDLKNNPWYWIPKQKNPWEWIPEANIPKYGDFIKACEALWRDPDIMYEELMLWIANIDEYVTTIQDTSSIK